VIEKFERQYLSGADVESALQSIQSTLYQYGIQVAPLGQNVWAGRSNQVSYGLRLKATITVMPAQTGFMVDLRIGSDVETNAIVLLVVLWLFFFPAAIVLAILGYQDVSTRQTQLCQAVWAPLHGRIVPANMGYYAQPPGVPPGPGAIQPGGQPPRPGS
jgi:hypothetical protein